MSKQFCKNGHDTHITGRTPTRACRICRQEQAVKHSRKPEVIEKQRACQLKRDYGVTREEVEAQLLRQHGRCLGCRKEVKRGKYRIDHNHKTGVFRGVLCHACNVTLGLVKEDKGVLRRLMTYLDYDKSKLYVYVIGALKNTRIPEVAQTLREAGFEAIDEWYSAGPEADSFWQQYEIGRGRNFKEALQGRSAENVFNFDRALIDLADCGVLIMPAGRSGHLELGYMAGQGKPVYILQETDPERYDVMPQFATGVFYAVEELVSALALLPSEEEKWCRATAAYLKDFAEGKNDHY